MTASYIIYDSNASPSTAFQMLEAEREAEEEALRRIEEEEKQQRLAAITQASRRSREQMVSAAEEAGKEQQSLGTKMAHSTATSPPWLSPTHPTACRVRQLDIPAELALVLQALTSE